MVVNKEKELYNPIIAGMVAEGWTMFRIEDGSFGKKPFDIAGIAPDGKGVGLEVKLTNKYDSEEFPWKLCSSHQVSWLKEYAKKGAYSLLAIYTLDDNKLRIWELWDDLNTYGHMEMILDKFKRYAGWDRLL